MKTYFLIGPFTGSFFGDDLFDHVDGLENETQEGVLVVAEFSEPDHHEDDVTRKTRRHF